MYAYNPQSGQTIEISEYGFKMLEMKGWTRHADQSPREGDKPKEPLPPPPVFDLKDIMEKRKQEIAAKNAGTVAIIETEITKPEAPPVKRGRKPKPNTNETN